MYYIFAVTDTDDIYCLADEPPTDLEALQITGRVADSDTVAFFRATTRLQPYLNCGGFRIDSHAGGIYSASGGRVLAPDSFPTNQFTTRAVWSTLGPRVDVGPLYSG